MEKKKTENGRIIKNVDDGKKKKKQKTDGYPCTWY